MMASNTEGSEAPLLALALHDGEEPETQLLGRALQALPKAPAAVLVLSRSPSLASRQLQDLGYDTTEVRAAQAMSSETFPSFETTPAPFQAVLSMEGLEFLADPARVIDRLLPLLAEGGVFIFLGIVSSGKHEEPSSLAALEVTLARHGVALSPPEDLSERVRTRARRLLEEGTQVEAQKAWLQPLLDLVSGDSFYFLLRGKKTAFSIRPYRPGDEGAIADLFESSFHHRRGEEHWRWQYLANPRGGPHVSAALDREGELVAHYAGYPMRFLEARPNGALEILEAHQIGDTMTAARVRHVGRGPTSLLSRTAAHFFAHFSTGRVAFNYGFNEGNIRRFSERFLGARLVEPVTLRRREIPADRSPFRTSTWWQKHAKKEAITYLSEPVAGCDALLQRALPVYRLLSQRDSAYLKWRYFERPGFRYWMFGAHRRGRLEAWAVFRREGETLLLGDLLIDPNHTSLLEPLLAAALASPAGEGARRIEGWFPNRPAFLDAELARLGFETHPHPQDLALMCLAFLDPRPEEFLRGKLFYTQGDSDLF